MKTLIVSLLVALACALAGAACERVVVLAPFPGDGGEDSSFLPDAAVDHDGATHLDGGSPFPDAFVAPG